MTVTSGYTSKRPGIFRLLLFSLCLFCVTASSFGQEKKISDVHVTINVTDTSFEKALAIIESQCPFRFAYASELIPQKKITLAATDMPLPDVVALLLKGTSISYNIIGNQIVLRNITAPPKVTLSGYIRDTLTGESLIGASIYIPGINAGTFSNNYGFYSITIPPSDTLGIELSYVGFKTETIQINARKSTSLSFNMAHNYRKEDIGKLVVANDKREDNVRRNQSAVVDISSDMIVNTPSVGGNGDVIGSVQMLPGVQSGLDGSPGYLVRGGNAGQNLVLLDEATLYNPSHIFGLVSIFNAPVIKNARLMKGGFSAAYGDYLSSVLDIAMKDGSRQQAGGIVQLGSILSGVTLYGPIQQQKSSFLVSARRSSVDWLLHPFLEGNYFSNYYFYDVNAKMNFQLSLKDRLFLSFYTGKDNNIYSTSDSDSTGIDYRMHFGNTAFVMRWNHEYSGKLFSNTSLIYNKYHQFLSATQDNYFAKLYSGIRDLNAKTDFSWYPSPSHKITTGINYLYQAVLPATVSNKVSTSVDSLTIDPHNIPEKISNRLAVYASDDIKLGPRFKAYLGLRLPVYFTPKVQYLNLEPRLSLLYMVDSTTSLKVSYTHMHQYLHLVQSYNSSFPAEIWIGSSKLVQPQFGQDISGGIFKNFSNNTFQTGVEFYYRQMENQLLFKGATTPAIDNNLEDQLVFGRQRNYGTEFLLRKNRGKLTGWLAYSLAYAYQQFDSLNLGQPFPFAYDRRHTLYVSTAYSLSNRWKVSANFFLASGRAFTFHDQIVTTPDSNPLYDGDDAGGGQPSSSFIDENNYRLRPSSRVDLSVSYKKTRVIGRKTLEAEWVFSIYNVYARNDASFAYRTIDPVSKQVVVKEVPFIPIIPSISYTLKF